MNYEVDQFTPIALHVKKRRPLSAPDLSFRPAGRKGRAGEHLCHPGRERTWQDHIARKHRVLDGTSRW